MTTEHQVRPTLTTEAGAPLADNQNTETAGPDGPMVQQRMESKVLHRVTVVALDAEIAKVAGAMRGEWKVRGTPVAYRDGLIAATAKAKGLVLVTRNVKHFNHIAGLSIENWFDPPPISGAG